MKKSMIIVRSNIRKAKGQMVAITVLILLASALMNLGLMLSTDYKKNFDRYHEKLNAEHVTLAVCDDSDQLRDLVSETLEKDTRTTGYCMDDALVTNGSIVYNGGKLSTSFVCMEKETALNRSVGKMEIVEDSAFTSGVYLPMIYGSDSNIAVGKTIEINFGGEQVSYTICGFFNSVMTGSHNCSMTSLLFTEDQYEKLKEKGVAFPSTLVSVRIADKDESEDFEAMLKNEVASDYPGVLTLSNSYASVSSARYISQMICSGIVNVMAFLTMMIALVVIASNVINYIQENMKNLGALKAVGYTSRQIIFSLVLQFLSVTLITSAVGIAISYGIFPAVNTLMISQTGIPYQMRFLPLPLVITIVLFAGATTFVVWLSSRKIKKIEPIIALRQGVLTHSFKKNHVPLEDTKAPLHLALALKTTFSGMKQNVTVCITMLVLSLVVAFSGLMVKNVIMDMEPFVNLIVGETADSSIDMNKEIETDFLQMMDEDERVGKVYLYNSIEISHVGGVTLTANISDDFSDLNNQSVCIEGKFPEYDNEIAIGARYANDQGLHIGDEITMTAEGREADYIICGYTQCSNFLGKDCLLTRSGFERMGKLSDVNYYINVADGTDIDKLNEEVKERFGNDVSQTVNIHSVLDATATVYVTLMTVIVIAILVLSAFIIMFVIYLLVRTMLNNKKRDYGILKAMGFTTGQLMLQTALSFMPSVILSLAVGLLVSAIVINPLTAVFLRGIGIVKCTFILPVDFIVATGLGIVVFTFAIACLLSLRIRRIDPKALIDGE
jgi:ABC-type antimicrobial peptide transport system permease subunit